MLIAHQIPLGPFTTLGIGGPAEFFAELRDRSEFADVLALARRAGATPVCLGYGSNVLVADDGCPVPVVRMKTTGITMSRSAEGDTVEVTVEAGHPLPDLIDTTIGHGLSGMEALIGIPGTVGATPVQNVGAYGQEIADTLVEVCAWDWRHWREVRLRRGDCGFGHRTSIFKRSQRWTLLHLTFALRPSPVGSPVTYREVAEVLGIRLGERVPLAETAAGVLAVRRRKGMILEPANPDNRSAGSVFVSSRVAGRTAARLREQNAPVREFPDGSTRISASWLIRKAGFELGEFLADGVRMSSQHYTLVTEAGANAAQFLAAAREVARRVREATGVLLELELDSLSGRHGSGPDWHLGADGAHPSCRG